jgi:cytochrome b561
MTSAIQQTPADPSTVRYTGVAQSLHWIMAVLILFSAGLGLLLDGWPRESKVFMVNIHAQIGLLVLYLLLARMWWRSTHTPPELPPEVSEISRRVSHPAHMLLYVLMLAVLLVGIVAFVWHARVLDFGFFSINFGIKSDKAIYERAEDIHLWLTYGLLALVTGHAIAALWHHFVSRDPVLVRMLPNRFSAKGDAGKLAEAKSS